MRPVDPLEVDQVPVYAVQVNVCPKDHMLCVRMHPVIHRPQVDYTACSKKTPTLPKGVRSRFSLQFGSGRTRRRIVVHPSPDERYVSRTSCTFGVFKGRRLRHSRKEVYVLASLKSIDSSCTASKSDIQYVALHRTGPSARPVWRRLCGHLEP